MIFNKKDPPKYWGLDKQAILTEHRSQVWLTSEQEINIEGLKGYPEEGLAIWFGEEPPKFPFLEADGQIRESTPKELLDCGIFTLEPTEFLDGDNVRSIYEIPIPPEIAKPDFDFKNICWVESGTPEEIAEHEKQLQKKFVEGELEDTNKFDLVNYRVFVTNQGDNIEEMDAYRLALLEMQQSLNAPVRTRARRSASFAVLKKPAWAEKY